MTKASGRYNARWFYYPDELVFNENSEEKEKT